MAHRLRSPAQHHLHAAALGVEFDHHIRTLIHAPDIVIPVDLDAVGEDKSVKAVANGTHVIPIRIKLQQTSLLAAVIDKDVALGIYGHARDFAQVHSLRQLEKIRDGLKRDFRNARLLSKYQRGKKQKPHNKPVFHAASSGRNTSPRMTFELS
ncbi:MAG: hypothetical protein P8Z30_05910 [Acidobacteriota bacterium]